jgi:hypothetical protein
MRRHSAHVDPDVLAELSTGLIDGRRAMRIHAHLAGCERCASVSARLSVVSDLLAAVPSPAMPESVTRRLSVTLAAEASARSAEAPDRLTGREAVHHAERGRGARSWTAWRGFTGPVAARAVAAAAAVCVLAAGGYTLAQLPSHGPAVAPQAKAVRPPAYGPKAGLNPPQGARTPTVQPGSVLPKFTVVQSGTDYEPAQLAAQIKHELADAQPGGPSASPGGPETVSTTTEEDCAYRITGGTRPTLVDEARYKGHAATVIALAPSAKQIGQAWVVGRGCSASASDIFSYVKLHGPGG